MAVNKRLLQGAAAAGGLVPSEHFGVVLYEGDGSTSHSINGGKFGAGGYFTNSSSSRIELSSAVLPADIFSVSLWINVSSLSDNKWILTQYTGGAGGRFVFNYNADGGLQINVASSNSLTSITATPLTENTWHHIVLIKNGSSGWELYVDNSSIGTWSDTNNILTSQNTVFGGNQNVTTQSIDGKIDQVRLFTKALSSSQVSTLYAETAATVESLDPLSEDTTDTLQVLGDSSCVATYRFENDEDDLSGNYDGTGTAIQYAAGRYGQAASFNGSSSNVDIGSFGSTFQQNFTVSLWFNLNSLSALNNLFSAQDDYYAYMMARNDINKVRAQIEVSPSTAYNIDSGTISTNTWYHAVITVSSTDGFKFYMNNELQGTQAAATGNLRTMSGKSFIGAYQSADPGTFQYPLDGKIDQVRIFNKAISASEVTTLYNENSLVASYRFEGNANDDTRNYDGSATNVTYEYGLGFTPDLVWIKRRDAGADHALTDSTRGVQKLLSSNSSAAEANQSPLGLTSFDTGGFTLSDNSGGGAGVNGSDADYVAWCFKANGGTTSSNTDGNVTTTVQVNSDAGFSIAKSASTAFMTSQTFGLGLEEEPDVVIVKSTDIVTEWRVYSKHLNNWDGFLKLNSTDALYTSSITTTVTSTTFSSNWTNTSGIWMLYSFKSIDSFSSFGTYTGNSSDNGPIVETGFEPAFLMIKNSSDVGSWFMYDNKRNTSNPRINYVLANASNVEASDMGGVDFLSNGFQIKEDHDDVNDTGDTYIYMAFAADPDTEAPTVAKSFSTVTYTGNGGTQSIDGLGFAPNLVWVKQRGGTTWHNIQDTINGATKHLYTNSNNALDTTSNGLTSFDSDGFTLGGGNGFNGSSQSMVAWAWKADDNEPTIFGGPAIAVYKFEDNANDVTGNNNGTASNVTYSSSGKFNKAVEFNGTNAYIDTGITNTVGQRSISLWFYYTGAPSATQVLIGGVSSGSAGYAIRLETTKLKFQNQGETGPETALSNLNTNDWNHVVGVIDGSTSKLYLNGSLEDTGGAADAGTHNLYIGARNNVGSADQYFDGKIDQVRIYNGAINDIGVAALYAETTSDNDDTLLGGPPETIISANANAGFSIVKYEGTGVAGMQVPHGLSAAPDMIIVKNLDTTDIWTVQHSALGYTNYIDLSSSNATTVNSAVWYAAPTSNVFSFGANPRGNGSGNEIIAYCFHSVSGYSKFGSYSGTGSSGNSVTTGFQPDWIMIKRTDSTGLWCLLDSVRGTTQFLSAEQASAEQTISSAITFTSTGFTLTDASGNRNASGGTYIYMAFKIN